MKTFIAVLRIKYPFLVNRIQVDIWFVAGFGTIGWTI